MFGWPRPSINKSDEGRRGFFETEHLKLLVVTGIAPNALLVVYIDVSFFIYSPNVNLSMVSLPVMEMTLTSCPCFVMIILFQGSCRPRHGHSSSGAGNGLRVLAAVALEQVPFGDTVTGFYIRRRGGHNK